MENLSNFHWELRSLYLENSREITTPNAWSRRDVRIIHKTKLYTIQTTTHTFELDAADAFKKYNKLMKDLEAYPEWQQKVRISDIF